MSVPDWVIAERVSASVRVLGEVDGDRLRLVLRRLSEMSGRYPGGDDGGGGSGVADPTFAATLRPDEAADARAELELASRRLGDAAAEVARLVAWWSATDQRAGARGRSGCGWCDRWPAHTHRGLPVAAGDAERIPAELCAGCVRAVRALGRPLTAGEVEKRRTGRRVGRPA